MHLVAYFWHKAKSKSKYITIIIRLLDYMTPVTLTFGLKFDVREHHFKISHKEENFFLPSAWFSCELP